MRLKITRTGVFLEGEIKATSVNPAVKIWLPLSEVTSSIAVEKIAEGIIVDIKDYREQECLALTSQAVKTKAEQLALSRDQ
jgi:F0F1-type ATP synthase alpha subunit